MPIAYQQTITLLLLLGMALVMGSAAQAKAISTEQLRSDFIEAERLLHQGEKSRARSIAKRLQDEKYPLYPYLLFTELRKYLGYAKPAQIEDFLNRYDDTPLAYRLRRSWLFHLARKKNWNDYLAFYLGSSNEDLRCHYLQALVETGRTEEASASATIDSLWLNGHSLPKSCDQVLVFWNKQGLLTPERVWARIELAMQAGKLRLARHLSQYLPQEEVRWLDTWQRVHRKPQLILDMQTLHGDHPVKTRIFVHAIKRMVRKDPLLAANTWAQHERHFNTSKQQHAEINKAIGLKLAYRDHQDALAWLESIPQQYTDQKVREWRIRSALNQHDWKEVLFWIGQLPDEERNSPQWKYWQARALEQQGETRQAHTLYQSLAQTRSFEGFLAADKLDMPYQYNHQELDIQTEEYINFGEKPAVVRAKELLLLGRMIDARREWYHATRGLGDRELQVAAKLAHSWDWHDQAILTLGRSTYRDDLELRFPLVFKDHVNNHSNDAQIDPAWAFAVIRQESAFNKDARSHRDARGLMQLLPRTARSVARTLNTRLRRTTDLHKAEINIQLGVHYLKTVMSRFKKNMVLATAAYNAGSYRIHRWLPKTDHMEADLWIETIPFRETRNYLKRVLTYTAIYEHRLGSPSTPLSQRMQTILPINGSPQGVATSTNPNKIKS